MALDEDTYRSLRELSTSEGVSTAGLVEAFARAALRRPRWLTGLVRDARRIDGERRSRLP